MPILDIPLAPPLAAWPSQGRLAILDLEWTAWDGSWQRAWGESWEWREIVQIGLLIVDAEREFAPLDGVEVLVRPQRNPQLSPYFQGLTGIKQAKVDSNGTSFPDAINQLQPFVDQADCMIFNGQDGQVLRENCSYCSIEFPWPQMGMFNFRPLLAQTLKLEPTDLVSSSLPTLAGLANLGKAHTALDDCRAIAAALSKWRRSNLL